MISAIESEHHLGQIAPQVFCADVVPRAEHSAFQERERIFSGVGVNRTPHVEAATVIDRLVFAAKISKEWIGFDGFGVGGRIIGDNHINRPADVVLDVAFKCPAFHVLNVEQSQFTASMSKADYDLLVRSASSFSALLDAANIGFIDLDCAPKGGALRLNHSLSNPMAEVPGGFVADSDGPLNLTGGHPLLRFAQQKRGEEPLFKWQMSVSEKRPNCACEVIFARQTEQHFAIETCYLRALAPWALNTFRPAEFFEKRAALFIRGVRRHEIRKSHGKFSRGKTRREPTQNAAAETGQGNETGIESGFAYPLRGYQPHAPRTRSSERRKSLPAPTNCPQPSRLILNCDAVAFNLAVWSQGWKLLIRLGQSYFDHRLNFGVII